MADIQIAKKSDLNNKADVGHVHTIADITNLQNSLNSKSDKDHNHNGVYAPVEHTHSYNNLTDKPSIPSNTNQLTNGAGFITSSYDNSTSGLSATDIQSAIDELKGLIDGLSGA